MKGLPHIKGIIALIVCCLPLLSGCVREEPPAPPPFTTVVDGQEATVIFDEGTYSTGVIETANGDYRFAYGFDNDVEITYPNGYKCTVKHVSGALAVSSEYHMLDMEDRGYLGYLSVLFTIDEAKHAQKAPEKSGNPLLGIFLIAIGAWNLISPRSSWWMSHGWHYKDAEPSELALGMYRFTGGAALITGLIMLFV